jgi:hypothetical protein
MDAALQGFLIGLAIAAFLLLAEYLLLNQASKARAKRVKAMPKFDDTERRRMQTMLRFSLVVPPAFAAFFWLIWG